MIGDIKPQKVTVIANQTKATNGKQGVEFTKDNWNYDEETGIININTKNETVENRVVWDKTQKDEYIITYIYPSNALEQITEESKISQNAITKINTYGTMEEAISNQEMEINIREVKGEYTSNSITTSIQQLSKGYLYSKVDKEIEYILKNSVEIQDTELVDKIQITNKVETIMLDEVEYALSNFSTYKYTEINKKVFDKILGEDGSLKIYNANGELISEINKDTEVENGNYIYKYEDKVDAIIIETSKPVIEGNLIIENAKAINCNTEYSNEQIKGFQNLKTTSQVKTILGEQQILHAEKSIQTQLIEPETKIEAEINKKELSTIVKNTGVQIKVILKTNDETCMLYENPVVEIELPNYIENVEINSIKLSYDNELTYDESKLYVGINNNGNQIIRVPLIGKDTDYNFDNVSKGANLLIDANLTLKKLTPTITSNINVNVYNNNGVEQNANTQIEVTAVAPVGMVTVTQVSGFNARSNRAMALNGEEQTLKLDVNSEERITNVRMDIINNYNNVCKNISILGKVPYNIAKLNSNISIDGIENNNVTIYYTTNENATKDLNIETNRWTTNVEDFSQVKLYLILLNNYEMATGNNITANYNLVIPAKLDYNLESLLTYTVYYDNILDNQTIKDVTTAANTTLTTGQGPELEVSVKSSVGEGKDVQEGTEIKYTVSVKNTGKSEVENANVKANVPNGSVYVYYLDNTEAGMSKQYDAERKEYLEKIETIKPNETKTIEFFVEALSIKETEGYDEETGELLEKEEIEDVILEVTGQATVEGYDKVFTSNTSKNKVVKGFLKINMELQGDFADVERKQGDTVEYLIKVKNVATRAKENVIVTCNIPKELEFTETTHEGKYNKTNNTVTWIINKLDGHQEIPIVLKSKVKQLAEHVYNLDISNKATARVGDKEIESNEVNITVRKPLLTAKLSSSTPKEVSLDDKIQYTLLITNEEKGTAYDITIEDVLPEGLIYDEIKYIQNGENYIIAVHEQNKLKKTISSMQGESTIEVLLTAKPDASVIKETSKEVANLAKISYKHGEEIITNEVKHTILPAGSTNDPSTDGDVIEDTYKISGLAWVDENKNGKREDEELKLEGIQVKLINAENGQVVKDIQTGKEKIQSTNSEGTYTFSNLKSGKYIVVYEYDNEKYDVTEYRKNGVSETSNSDAISSKISENGITKQVAATDTIEVVSSNIYNMDIGLIVKSKFKLDLEKSISKVTVVDSKQTRVYNWDDTKLAKIDIDPKRIDETNIIVEYKIKVSNVGDVEGYAKRIVDYVPQNMKFSSELNKDWYTSENGNLYNSSLANTPIKPGETKELTLVLSRKLTKDTMGIVNNKAEIYESYNNLGIPNEGSTPGNKVDGENDMSMADLAISIKTGEVPMYIGITVGLMAIFSVGLYFIKKKVLTDF